jgi:hypothetical protein
VRRQGDREKGRRGEGEKGRRGEGEKGRRGDKETRRQGEVETRRQGDKETRAMSVSVSEFLCNRHRQFFITVSLSPLLLVSLSSCLSIP